MNETTSLRVRRLLACTMTAAMGFAAPAVASPPIQLPPPDSPLIWDAGIACDFTLRLDLSGSNFHLKQYFDKNGDVVRMIIAGKGSAITYTNLESGAALSTKANGFSIHETYGADGTIMDTITGHVVLILFPSDVPAGPSTTLYVGKLVLTIDPNTGVSTLQSFSGKATDICAALE